MSCELTLTGIVPGSRYAVLEKNTNRVLYNEIAEEPTVKVELDYGPVIVRVRNMDYIPVEFGQVNIEQDTTISVFQTPETFGPYDDIEIRPPSVVRQLFQRAIAMLLDPELDLYGIEEKECQHNKENPEDTSNEF